MDEIPPPPIIECVAPENARSGSSYLVLSGDPAQLEAFLSERRSELWVVEAKAVSNGVGFARLKGRLNVPYREIGGLVYYAQVRHLTADFFTVPRICGIDDE